jgi:hypothetical protein
MNSVKKKTCFSLWILHKSTIIYMMTIPTSQSSTHLSIIVNGYTEPDISNTLVT